MTQMQVRGKDRIEAYHSEYDREIVVWNHVNVVREHYVNSVNGHETFSFRIGAGQSKEPPNYVTQRISSYLYREWGIKLSTVDHIEVIDLESDEVEVL